MSGTGSTPGARRGDSARTNPARSAPAAAAAATSSSRVSPHTLTRGRAMSSASLAAGSGAFMSEEPTRTASAPASSAAAPCALLQMPLSATTTRFGCSRRALPGHEPQLGGAVDGERREVAGVDADRVRAERQRPRELGAVVRLDEGIQAGRGRRGHEARTGHVVEVAEQEQQRVGARFGRGLHVGFIREEALGEQGDAGRGPRGPQVVPAAAEALGVDEDRHGGGPGPLVGGGKLGGVGIGTQVAHGRRAALDLRHRGKAAARRGRHGSGPSGVSSAKGAAARLPRCRPARRRLREGNELLQPLTGRARVDPAARARDRGRARRRRWPRPR